MFRGLTQVSESERREGARLLFEVLKQLEVTLTTGSDSNSDLLAMVREVAERLDISVPLANLTEEERDVALARIRGTGFDFDDAVTTLSASLGPSFDELIATYKAKKAALAELQIRLAQLDQMHAQLRDDLRDASGNVEESSE